MSKGKNPNLYGGLKAPHHALRGKKRGKRSRKDTSSLPGEE